MVKTTQNEKPSKKEASRELTKRKLLDTALRVFAKKGFEASTTKLIATKAKVNEALIFRYFGDKDGLLLAVILEQVASFDLGAERYPLADSLEQEVKNFVHFTHQDHMEHLEFLRVAISRALVDRKMLQKIMENIPMFGNPIFTDRLKGLRSRGLLRKDVNVDHLSAEVSLFCSGCMITLAAAGGEQFETIQSSIDSFARTVGRAWGA